MTKNRSRNPHTKKGSRTAPTTASAAKKTVTKRAGTKMPASKPVVAKSASPAIKNTKTAAKKMKVPAKTPGALTLVQRIVAALENVKGKDIVCMDVRKLTDVTDTLVIVSGTSSRHVKSLADNAAMELKKAGRRAYNIEGDDAGEWVLVDFGDAVLHVMQPQIREFYDLEKLWSTPSVDTDPVSKKSPPKKSADKSRE